MGGLVEEAWLRDQACPLSLLFRDRHIANRESSLTSFARLSVHFRSHYHFLTEVHMKTNLLVASLVCLWMAGCSKSDIQVETEVVVRPSIPTKPAV